MTATEHSIQPSVIKAGSRVTLNFSLKLENGDIVDSTFDREPASLVIGDGNLPAGFEKFLLGLKPGTREVFRVPPEDAFGQHNSSNIQTVERSRFAPDMELAKGLVVSFADPAGGELPGVISQYDNDFVTVDFNHPLAGKLLDFEVEVISVGRP